MRALNVNLVSTFAVLCLSAFASTAAAQSGPAITSLSPASGAVGATVTIAGSGFGSSQGTSTIAFNGTTATPSSWSATSIVVVVPTGATTGNVVVTVSGTASNGVTFTVVPAPSITSLSPTSGAIGAEANIEGANFGASQGSGSVTFNGTVAVPTSWSASTISVPVPSGATTGNVIVNASGVASGGVNFTVVPAPSITSLSVTSGVVGTSVTISGTNFGSTQGTGTVSFNGTDATPTSWTSTSIVTTVPTEATTGNVVVSASGVASNGVSFTVLEGFGITSISPTSGVVGEQVTLSGIGFGATQGSSTLKLNGTTATVAAWSDTSILAYVPTGATSGPFTVTVNSQPTSSGTFTVTALPSGWSDGDIGSVGLSGSASFANGTFTVKGAGQGTFSTPDSFHFVYQSLSGDGTVVARVASVTGGSAPQAGVMIRETLDPSATNAFTFYYQNFVWLAQRVSSGGSVGYQSAMNNTPPYWVKVVRSGSTFTGYGSADGINWTQVGSSQTISMASNVYIGLGVTSRSTSSLTTATFDGVSVNPASSSGPVITSISATTGWIGSQVTISGTGFGATQNGSVVTLGGLDAPISSWSSTSITTTVPTGATSGNFLVSVAPSMDDSNPIYFTVTSQPLPSSWLDADVGAVGLAGSATYVNGTFTITGAGLGTFATPDGFHFVYQPLSGDGTIVARVVSVTGGSSSQAGVMIRDTLDPSAKNGFTFYYSSSAYMSERTASGGSPGYQSGSSVSLPYWLMLIRSGTSLSGYSSYNGLTWTQVGSTQTISMAQTVYIGLGVTSRSTSSSTTATFDNVSVSPASAPAPVITSVSATTGAIGSQVVITGTGFGAQQNGSAVMLNDVPVTINSWDATSIVITIPTGATSGYMAVSVAPSMNDSNPVYFTITSQPLPNSWLDADIGAVGLAGSATYANSTFTIVGAGGGTLATPDGFHFVYQPLSGDGTIVARVVSVTGGYAPQAGLMLRETLDPSAKNAFAFYYQSGVWLSERTTSGGSVSYQSGPSVSLPYWIMLVRSGTSLSGYSSYNGLTWTQVGSTQTISMAQTVYIGLGVTSRSTSSSTTATFDNVSLSPVSAPAPAITSMSATTGAVGSQVAITGTGFGASQNGSLVVLNDAAVSINSWSSTLINVTIPTGATSGYLTVSVAPSMNNSNPVYFTVTANPLASPWLDEDVGQVGLSGSATYSGGTFTVNGSGSRLTVASDQMHFVYQPMSGDGTIVARVVTLGGSTYPQAALMIRETLDPAAKDAYLDYQSAAAHFYYRSSAGATESLQAYTTVSGLPYWLKLVRSSNTFYAYISSDGVSWTQVGTGQSVSMATSVYVGLAVCSQDNTKLDTGTFDNVSLTIGTTPVVTGVSPGLGATGTSVVVAGSSFGSTQGTSTLNFNGTAATSITSWNNSQIVALVPSAAPAGPDPVVVTVGSNSSPATVDFTVIKPTIASLNPPGAQLGARTIIVGSGFGASQGTSQVKFNNLVASVSSWSDTSITAQVPSSATNGPVTVTVDGIASNGAQFTVLEALTITGISQTAGSIGTTITITGTGFGATQSNSTLSFYGATATITSWSDTQIVATVPAFSSSGPVSVGVGEMIITGPWFTLTSTANLTDSLGNPTTYVSAVIGGSWVPLSAQGSGCSTCTVRGTISNTYDTYGDLLTHTDELGRVTTYTYDANGNPTSVSQPIAPDTFAKTTYTYNNFGEVLTTTDPLGFVTTNNYDAKGNLLSVATPPPATGGASSVTQFTYNSLGELTQITDPLNHATTLTYYSTGLINAITDAQNNVTTYAYDSRGNRTSVTDANSKQTTFTYDSMNRLTKITYPDTTTTQFGYDTRGRRTSVTDQNGKVTSYAYDDADRLTTVTDAASNVTTYGYDTENNLTSIQDANSHTTSFAYDAFGRVTKTTFPSGYIEQYYYDAVGNLTSKTDRKNQTITYTYDQLNRLLQKAYPDSTAVNYTYDNDSRLTQVVDPTGTYSFTFDNMGRLTQAVSQYTFLTGRNFTTGYSYDAASNRTGLTDPESGSTTYAYDTLNRLQTLTPPTAFTSGNFGFSYDALSRRTQMTRPNSITTTYSYDNLSRLLSVLHKNGSTTLDGASYTVDNTGNRTAKTDQYASVTSNYTYDSIYELTQVTQGTNTAESYSFDPVGNRTASLGVSSYTNNSSNELTATPSTTYSYDNNGNLTSKTDSTGTTQYFWDFENRLTSVTLPGSGGTVTFKYDPFGRRIYKSSSSATSVFAYDGDNLIEEANSSGAAVARYSQGLNIDEPLAMLRSSTTSFYNTDGLGSVTSLGNAAGALAQTYTFDSFGKQTASSGSLTNPFKYTARESDSETGLYYYRARYYDPSVGRFLREDSVRFGGGTDFYIYAGNRPVGATDSSGADYTVSYGPNGITINAAITLYGPGATVDLAARWQKYITDFWDKNPGFKGCTINFNVSVSTDPTANHWFTASPTPNFSSASQNYWFVPTQPGDPQMSSFFTGVVPASTLQFSVRHEFGHLLGLWDTNLGNGHVFGDPSDIMAEGDVVTQYDIDSILWGDWLSGQNGHLVNPKCACK